MIIFTEFLLPCLKYTLQLELINSDENLENILGNGYFF